VDWLDYFLFSAQLRMGGKRGGEKKITLYLRADL